MNRITKVSIAICIVVPAMAQNNVEESSQKEIKNTADAKTDEFTDGIAELIAHLPVHQFCERQTKTG